MPTPLPPRWRCPWFLGGLAAGLLLGTYCIHIGTTSTAQPLPIHSNGNH